MRSLDADARVRESGENVTDRIQSSYPRNARTDWRGRKSRKTLRNVVADSVSSLILFRMVGGGGWLRTTRPAVLPIEEARVWPEPSLTKTLSIDGRLVGFAFQHSVTMAQMYLYDVPSNALGGSFGGSCFSAAIAWMTDSGLRRS